MNGVPKDLNLDGFVGSEFCFIGLGVHQIQFHMDGVGNISVEGHWTLHDATGNLVDRDMEHAEREAYRIHRIIDVPVVGYVIDAPQSFTLQFKSGHRLTVFDDESPYESCSIGIDGRLYII